VTSCCWQRQTRRKPQNFISYGCRPPWRLCILWIHSLLLAGTRVPQVL
jgi:hypothetical protein